MNMDRNTVSRFHDRERLRGHRSVCGVSTPRVDQLVESLGLRISRSEVSRIAGLLDAQV
jgi:hypothetical protein